MKKKRYQFYKTVREFEELKSYEVEIVFINDGSKDATESIINALAVSDPLVVPLSFTRNFGKEPALFAGLDLSLIHISTLKLACLQVDSRGSRIQCFRHLLRDHRNLHMTPNAGTADRNWRGFWHKRRDRFANPMPLVNLLPDLVTIIYVRGEVLGKNWPKIAGDFRKVNITFRLDVYCRYM